MNESLDGKIMGKEHRFINELTGLLNECKQDELAKTPDFILAEYLNGCLKAFIQARSHTKQWDGE